jgi:hypothetical protein
MSAIYQPGPANPNDPIGKHLPTRPSSGDSGHFVDALARRSLSRTAPDGPLPAQRGAGGGAHRTGPSAFRSLVCRVARACGIHGSAAGGATILRRERLVVVNQSRMRSLTLHPPPISSRTAIVVGIMSLALVAGRVPSGRASEWSAKEICSSHVCRTITANATVRVFHATGRRGYDIVFAEWLPTHQVREIDFPRGEPLTATALAGSVVAHAVRYASGTAVLVYAEDLQPGHGNEGGGWIAADDLEAGSSGVRNLAVTRSGSIAWLVEGHFLNPADPTAGPHPNSRAIFCASQRTGEPMFLAYGPSISPSALRADASRCRARTSTPVGGPSSSG